MVFEWGFNIMMSGLPIWWSTAIAVAVFGKVFMSLLCMTAIAVTVFGIILLVLPCIDLYSMSNTVTMITAIEAQQ